MQKIKLFTSDGVTVKFEKHNLSIFRKGLFINESKPIEIQYIEINKFEYKKQNYTWFELLLTIFFQANIEKINHLDILLKDGSKRRLRLNELNKSEVDNILIELETKISQTVN